MHLLVREEISPMDDNLSILLLCVVDFCVYGKQYKG